MHMTIRNKGRRLEYQVERYWHADSQHAFAGMGFRSTPTNFSSVPCSIFQWMLRNLLSHELVKEMFALQVSNSVEESLDETLRGDKLGKTSRAWHLIG